MKLSAIGLRVALCTMAVALAGVAQAACYIGTETNASSVQEDSGNGTYNCSVVSTSNNALANVTSQVTWSVAADGTVTWSVPVTESGYPRVDVDLVSVNRSSGKRCNYTYAEQKAGGMKLSTSDLGAATSVTVCADGVITPEPPPPPPPTPEPFSTAKDGCFATFDNTGEASNFDVAIGYSKQFQDGLYEGAAICAGPGQKQCINECVPRNYSDACPADPDGKFNLNDCAQCEWDAPASIDALFKDAAGNAIDMKYCWFYENRVDETADTFKPSPKKKSLSANIDVTTGSNCYTVTVGPMYGGRTYSYWYCPQ
jgi:hypothetical protein